MTLVAHYTLSACYLVADEEEAYFSSKITEKGENSDLSEKRQIGDY